MMLRFVSTLINTHDDEQSYLYTINWSITFSIVLQLNSSELARASRFAAKFHYSVWFAARSELVRSCFAAIFWTCYR